MDRKRPRDLSGTATAPGDGPLASDPQGQALVRGASLGRYIIVDTIGVGGTGIVYSAFDPDLDRKVALKLLRKSHGQASRARLLREAQAMAKLSHPHVVTVFEVGTDGTRDFVAMEFVDGQDLAGWSETERSPEDVLSVYRQAGEGLAAAHRAGLVHRDFKPQNVLIDRDGKVLVTDFGLARHEESPEPSTQSEERDTRKPTLTRTGAIMGTPAYMAPEQHLAQDTDPRSDQFSFCVALHEALCGTRPYDAETYDELRAAVTEGRANALPDSVAVSAPIRAALEKGMARNPEERHASMEELLLLLASKPRRLAPYVVGALAAAAIVAIAVVRLSATEAPERCQFDRSMLAGAWDEQIRGKVADSFAGTGVDGAAQVFARLEAIVDDYGDDIVTMRTQVCESSRGGREADEVFVLQMSCLQRRRQDMAALTTAFSSVDPRGVDRVIEAASGLRPVSDCRDVQALQRGVPAPPNDVKDEVVVLQNSLEEARLEGEAGHVRSAIERAESAKNRSLELAYLPLQAESYETLGHLYVRDVRMREAEKAYEEAILAAEESGYTEYRARALVGMTQLVATGSSRYSEARRLARRAKAAISQGGGDPDLVADVDLSMANILMQEGELAEGLALLENSLRSYRAQVNPKVPYIARLQNRIASIRMELGDYDEAHDLAQSSHEQLRAELGASHPSSMSSLTTLAITHRMRGELREARVLDRELRTYWATENAKSLLQESDDYSEEVRSIRGRVVDAEDEPVAGATVVCAQTVVADARFLDAAWNPRREAIDRYDRAFSGDDGAFHCDASSRKDVLVVAEHEQLGRSSGHTIKEDQLAVTELKLRLQPTGFLSGQITKDGSPARGAQSVSAVPVESDVAQPGLAARTFLRSDGSYSFERLAPGRYKVFSGPRSSRAVQLLRSKDVTIVSGRGAELDFDHSEGDAALTVRVRGEAGANVPSAQVLLVPGHVETENGKAFNDKVVAKGLDVRSHFWNKGSPLKLDELAVGAHSLCVVPLAGDFRDPEYMSKFTQDMLDKIPVHCQDITLTSGKVLEVRVEVPALQTLVELEPADADGE